MRDFFYNKNDVLVAIVIVLIAAFVIYMRVGVIMDYPARAAGAEPKTFMESLLWWNKDQVTQVKTTDNKPAVETPAQTETDTSANAVTPDPKPATPPVVETPEPVVQDPPPEVTPEPTPPPATPPATPPTEVSITVVAGDVGSTIGDKLVSAGAITDKAAFLAEVTAQGADTKLKQGTFKIPAGSSLAEIVKILVG